MRRELYYERVLNEEELRARFDVVGIDDEGILIDREAGGVYRLNRTACEIWTALMAGQSIAEIGRQLCARFGLDEQRAARDVQAVLQEIREVPPKPVMTAPTQTRWGVTPRGYGHFAGDSLVCEVDPRGESLHLAPESHPTVREAQIHLRTAVPKILALRGIRAIHASAVEIGGALLVFSGRSGAGKTTSARAFAEAGGRLVSEDILILRPREGGPEGVLSAEPVIAAWIADEGKNLAARPDRTVDCQGLNQCLQGEGRRIKRILLIDSARRDGARMITEDLSRPDALAELVESVYFGSTDPLSWTDTFESLRNLVNSVEVARAVMPLGIPALSGAASAFRYSEITTS